MATAKKAPVATKKSASAKAAPVATKKSASAKAATVKVAALVKAAAPKKATAKVTTPTKKAPAAQKPIKETLKKTGLINHLVETTGVDIKDVKAVLAGLENTMVASLSKKGAREFLLPGLLKVTAVATPATKARKGINRFTGEETTFKAKPASVKIRLRAMKKLKDAAL